MGKYAALSPCTVWSLHGALCRLLAGMSAVALSICILMIAGDIVLRYLKLGNLPWAIELTEYTIYAATFLGAPWVLAISAHIRMDAVTSLLGDPARTRLARIERAIGCSVASAIALLGAWASASAYQDEMVTRQVLNYPEWIVLLPIPVSGFLMAVEFALQAIDPDRGRSDNELPVSGA